MTQSTKNVTYTPIAQAVKTLCLRISVSLVTTDGSEPRFVLDGSQLRLPKP